MNTQDIAITLAGLIYIRTAASKLTVRARVGLEAAAERLPLAFEAFIGRQMQEVRGCQPQNPPALDLPIKPRRSNTRQG
jgi:hypothetical protein